MASALTPRQRKITIRILAAIPFITAALAIADFAVTRDSSAFSLLILAFVFYFANRPTLQRAKAAKAAADAEATPGDPR